MEIITLEGVKKVVLKNGGRVTSKYPDLSPALNIC